MNWRGQYEGGGMVVTAKHWWSPNERKAARLAAMVLTEMRKEITPGSVISYPYGCFKVTWAPRD